MERSSLRPGKKITLMLIVSALLLIGLVIEAGPDQVAQRLAKADLTIIFLAMAIYLAGLGVKALRWRTILRSQGSRVPIRSAFIQTTIGQAMNDLTPVKVMGEASKIYGINAQESVPYGAGMASIITEKILDLMLVTSVIVISVLLLLPDLHPGARNTLLIVTSVIVCVNIVSLLMLRRPAVLQHIGERVASGIGRYGRGRISSNIEQGIRGSLHSFRKALDAPHQERRGLMLAAALLTVLLWGLEFGRLYFVVLAFGAFASLPAVAITSTLAITLQVFLPAGSGNVFVTADVLSNVGITLTTATAVGILSVITSIWISVPLAIIAMAVLGREMRPARRPE